MPKQNAREKHFEEIANKLGVQKCAESVTRMSEAELRRIEEVYLTRFGKRIALSGKTAAQILDQVK